MSDTTPTKPQLNTDELKFYVESLEKASSEAATATSGSDDLILNGGILHALAVYTQMIKNLILIPESKACFYCGNAVLFRKNAYDDIIDTCKNKYSKYPDKEYIEQLCKEFHTTLRNFIGDKTHKLFIVVEKQSLDEYDINPIIPVLSENKEQFSFSMLPFNLGLPHFAVAGKAYRFEVSDSDKTAFCSFNGKEERLSTMNATFSHLLKLSLK